MVILDSFKDTSQCQHLRNPRSTLAKAKMDLFLGGDDLMELRLLGWRLSMSKLIPLEFPVSLQLRDLGIVFKSRMVIGLVSPHSSAVCWQKLVEFRGCHNISVFRALQVLYLGLSAS